MKQKQTTPDTPQTVDMVAATEDLARDGLPSVQAYFRAEHPGDDAGDRVDRAIKVLGIYSRMRATRANEMGVAVMVARMMGLKGEALGPLWSQLTGTEAQQFLPPAPAGQ